MISPHDADLVQRDPAVPGLRVLLDPSEFAATLRRLYPSLEICEARNLYLRYKPGTNCLAAYQIKAGQTSVDVFAKAYRRRASKRLKKAEAKIGVNGPFGTSQSVVADLGLVVSVFPYDRRLRSLNKLFNDESRARLLRKLFPESPRLWQGSVNVLRYNPERRCVVQHLVNGRPEAVLRFYTEHGYRAAWQSSKCAASRGSLRVASRLGRLNREMVLALEWLPGRVLADTLSDTAETSTALGIVGSALAELHSQYPKHPEFLIRKSEVTNLLSVADGLAFICPQIATLARRLAERLGEHLFAVPRVFGLIHGDFHAKQVVLETDKVGIIDLDEVVYGDPASDVGNFIAHLRNLVQRGILSADRVHRLSAELIDGYRNASCRASKKQVDIYTAAGLLRLAQHPFRNREHDWPQQIEGLLIQANALLDSTASQHASAYARQPDWSPVPIEIDETRVVDRFEIEHETDIPHFKLAINPVHVRRLFEHSLQHAFHNCGRICLAEIRVIRHKPGRRCLIEYQFRRKQSSGVWESFSLIGKAHARRANVFEFQLAGSLWTEGFDDTCVDGISIPEPIGLVPELRMWFQRKVPGESAIELLTQADGIGWARRIADAIYKVHRAEIPTGRCHTIGDELQILHDRLREVACHYPRWEKRVRRILEKCDELSMRVPPHEFCGIHRDFYPQQIVVDSERIYLLDFDLYCQGDPALDVGNFVAHLIEHALRKHHDPFVLLKQQQAFEDRYTELSGGVFRESIAIFTTLSLARHISLSTRFSNRRTTTEALVDLCENRLRQHAHAGV